MFRSKPKSQREVTWRVAGYAFALAVVGGLLHLTSRPGLKLPLSVPYPALVLAFFLAGSAPLILEVGRQGFSLSMTEIPLILGLLSTQRTPLVIYGTIGWFASRIFDRRMAKTKLLFNVPLTMLEISVAIAVFDLFKIRLDPGNPQTWIALMAAITLSVVSSTTAVNGVILLTADSLSFRQAFRHTILGLLNALGASIITIAAIILLQRSLATVIMIAAFSALVIIPLRRFAVLQRRFESLERLHEFTAGLSQSIDVKSNLEGAAAQCASVLRAEAAEVILPHASRLLHGLSTAGAPFEGDEVWNRVFVDRQPIVVSRLDKSTERYRNATGIKDLIAVPLIHDDEVLGVFVVRDRQGDVSTFDTSDLAILSTMANQTTVILQNLRLIDELRTEAATRQHQALHDDLTGLPNRTSLMTRIDRSISFCKGRSKFGVALIDLNRFKDINDTLGHHVGDRVLVEYSRRLMLVLPSGSFASRLGGDEFAVVSGPIPHNGNPLAFAEAVATAFNTPIVIDGLSLQIDGATGVAVYPDHGTDRAVLLKRADVAMYAAKDGRGETICLYEPSQEQSTLRQLALIADLNTAVLDRSLDVYFQPKALIGGQIVGAEALARWNHPTFGPVAPDEFIPLAEHAGVIRSLTTYLTDASLGVCGQWLAKGLDLSVAVNLDSLSLKDPHFVDSVASLLEKHQVPAKLLTFEITERVVVSELEDSIDNIERLRRLGVQFSIDDFGTGYSSLSYISKLPVDEVKIDKAFVFDVATSAHHAAIVRAVTDIAHSLGLRTVAEGVETIEAWDALRSYGVDVIQGYYLSRPKPVAEFESWVTNYETTRLYVS
jgi:diguanylate cyclase (GGDEF)-like protein